jgi:hypothetical protein
MPSASALLQCVLPIVASLAFTILLFRPFTREILISRVPFFLEILFIMLIFGLMDVPLAFPRFFLRVWRLPLDYDMAHSGSEWVGQYWLDPCLWAGYGALFLGLPWAIVNLIARRAMLLNVVALVASLLWIGASLVAAVGGFGLVLV